MFKKLDDLLFRCGLLQSLALSAEAFHKRTSAQQPARNVNVSRCSCNYERRATYKPSTN